MSGFYWYKGIVYWLSLLNRPIMPNSSERFILIAGQSAYVAWVTAKDIKNLMPATEEDFKKSNTKLNQ